MFFIFIFSYFKIETYIRIILQDKLFAVKLSKSLKGGATLDLAIFRGLAKIQELTVSIFDEWRMVISC